MSTPKNTCAINTKKPIFPKNTSSNTFNPSSNDKIKFENTSNVSEKIIYKDKN